MKTKNLLIFCMKRYLILLIKIITTIFIVVLYIGLTMIHLIMKFIQNTSKSQIFVCGIVIGWFVSDLIGIYQP